MHKSSVTSEINEKCFTENLLEDADAVACWASASASKGDEAHRQQPLGAVACWASASASADVRASDDATAFRQVGAKVLHIKWYLTNPGSEEEGERDGPPEAVEWELGLLGKLQEVQYGNLMTYHYTYAWHDEELNAGFGKDLGIMAGQKSTLCNRESAREH